jgi:isoleucyl-tRNA synthetase
VLGNLYDFDPSQHQVAEADMSDLDRYALARLDDLCARVRKAYDDYEFHVVFRALVDYVTVELSAFYLDVTKDRLYCDGPGWKSRRAAQTVLWRMGRALATLAAPILCFTAEDVWRYLPRAAGDPASVHLALLPDGRALDEGGALARRFATLLGYRQRVLAALEPFRAAKHSATDAHVTLRPLAADRAALAGREAELADLFGVSRVTVGADATGAEPEVAVAEAPGKKCPRCWKWHEDAGALDARCDRAMAERATRGAA